MEKWVLGKSCDSPESSPFYALTFKDLEFWTGDFGTWTWACQYFPLGGGDQTTV